jgi:dolichol-phosphate mannosyltransferase
LKHQIVSADLAIIVPVFNEQDNVLPMLREVAAALARESRPWELVFVDDGSTDATWTRIAEAQRQDARVRGLRHQRNAGQSAAVWTGIQHTTSPLLATLDGDLQNDPAELPRLLALLGEVDFICGDRTANRRDSWLRRVSSAVARGARRLALRYDFRDTGCALRVFKREALAGIAGFNGLHRFLPILVAGGGFKTREVPVNHRPRVAGVSKYGVWNRAWRGLYDLVGVAWYQRRRLKPVAVEELP